MVMKKKPQINYAGSIFLWKHRNNTDTDMKAKGELFWKVVAW
jgi:hypothetical protein